MCFMKTTAVALALAVGGLSAPISSPLTATDTSAAERKANNKRGNKRVVVHRKGVRQVDGRYFYDGRYYDENEALAAGLIGFAAGAAAGALLGGALSQPTVVDPQ
jgi:hypothetical protein